MTKNPILNALSAALYIALVASIMYFGSQLKGPIEPSLLVPITVLSLFSLSVAVMGFIFLYQPVLMYLEGEKAAATKLLLQTIASFAVITFIFLGCLLSFNFL